MSGLKHSADLWGIIVGIMGFPKVFQKHNRDMPNHDSYMFRDMHNIYYLLLFDLRNKGLWACRSHSTKYSNYTAI